MFPKDNAARMSSPRGRSRGWKASKQINYSQNDIKKKKFCYPINKKAIGGEKTSGTHVLSAAALPVLHSIPIPVTVRALLSQFILFETACEND